jgi:AcrR family transcriptional regulator
VRRWSGHADDGVKIGDVSASAATSDEHGPERSPEPGAPTASSPARPEPADALSAAGRMVYEGVRVDMGELAQRVGVGRATLYRWFGSRDGLLDALLERFALVFLEQARERAEGEGDAWVLDISRRLMEATVEFEPARRFVAREPHVALRLLLGEGGAVHRTLSRALREALIEVHSEREMTALEPSIEPMVQIATALQWATFAIGDEPKIEQAIELMGLMLAAAREGGAGRG